MIVWDVSKELLDQRCVAPENIALTNHALVRARFADRRDEWSVFGFETALDPEFARAQRRYLGASGSADHNDLRGWIPATAFTMSIL